MRTTPESLDLLKRFTIAFRNAQSVYIGDQPVRQLQFADEHARPIEAALIAAADDLVVILEDVDPTDRAPKGVVNTFSQPVVRQPSWLSGQASTQDATAGHTDTSALSFPTPEELDSRINDLEASYIGANGLPLHASPAGWHEANRRPGEEWRSDSAVELECQVHHAMRLAYAGYLRQALHLLGYAGLSQAMFDRNEVCGPCFEAELWRSVMLYIQAALTLEGR